MDEVYAAARDPSRLVVASARWTRATGFNDRVEVREASGGVAPVGTDQLYGMLLDFVPKPGPLEPGDFAFEVMQVTLAVWRNENGTFNLYLEDGTLRDVPEAHCWGFGLDGSQLGIGLPIEVWFDLYRRI
jgi:hypothetical protein